MGGSLSGSGGAEESVVTEWLAGGSMERVAMGRCFWCSLFISCCMGHICPLDKLNNFLCFCVLWPWALNSLSIIFLGLIAVLMLVIVTYLICLAIVIFLNYHTPSCGHLAVLSMRVHTGDTVTMVLIYNTSTVLAVPSMLSHTRETVTTVSVNATHERQWLTLTGCSVQIWALCATVANL